MVSREFDGQQEGEEVLAVFRLHRSVMMRGILLTLSILVVSFIPLIICHNQAWAWYLPLLGIALISLIGFNTWLKWYYSVYILTDRRIRQQLQRNLFRKSVVDIYLNKVQNISYNIRGLRGSLLGYGTIIVQTVTGDLIMTKIADCEKVYNQLSAAVQAARPTDDDDFDEKGENGDQEER